MDYSNRWIPSSQYSGSWTVTNEGLVTADNNRLYGISAKLNPFSNYGNILSIEYTTTFSQSQTCSGNFLLLFSNDIDQNNLGPFYVSFGANVCNGSPFNLQIQFLNSGQYYTNRNSISGQFALNTPITYKLVINPDSTYYVFINSGLAVSGSLKTDFTNQNGNGLTPAGSNLCQYPDIGYVGFQMYQLQAGVAFDNIIISTSPYSTVPFNFFEQFSVDTNEYAQRWIQSSQYPGQFALTNYGLTTMQDNKLYGISAKLFPFSNYGGVLTMQFTVRFSQTQTCSGNSLRLFPYNYDLNTLSSYYVSFGPDVCGGPFNLKIQFSSDGQYYTNRNSISGQFALNTPITYKLVLSPDNAYYVFINTVLVAFGSLKTDFTNQNGNGLGPVTSNVCQYPDIGGFYFAYVLCLCLRPSLYPKKGYVVHLHSIVSYQCTCYIIVHNCFSQRRRLSNVSIASRLSFRQCHDYYIVVHENNNDNNDYNNNHDNHNHVSAIHVH